MAAPVLLIPTTATFDAELAARSALDGKVWWKIEVDEDADGYYVDYTSSLDNNRVRVAAEGSVFKDGIAGTAQFALRNVPKLFDAGDLAGVPVKISVKIGTGEYIQVFSGYVDPQGVERDKRNLTEDVAVVTASDPSKARAIARKADAQTLYVGKYICKTTDTGNSLVHLLAAKLGLTPATDLDVQAGTALELTKDYVFVNKDASYWRELQDLALAHNCLLGFRYDGKLRLARWTEAEWNAPEDLDEYTFNSTNVHSFRAVGSDILCNRAKVEYEQWQALDAGRIAKCLEGYNETTKRNAITIAAGEYWPGGTDEYAVARLSYERGGERFPIGVSITTPTIAKNTTGRKNTAEIQYTGSGTLELESFNGTAGTDTSKTSQHADASEIILKNSGASPVTVFHLELNGTPIRVLSETTVQHKVASLDDWEYVDKDLPGKYITSRAQAEATCQRWTSFGKEARQRFEAVCDFTPHLQPGAVVVFNPTADISMYAMVEAYEHASEGPHTLTRTRVTLVELADFTETAGDSDVTETEPAGRVAGAGSISGTDIEPTTLSGEHFAFGSDGSAAVYDGYDALPAGAELFDLRQPDCRSHLGRSPNARENLVYFPGYLKDETEEEYASGWTAWSGLGVIGAHGDCTNLVDDPEDLTTSSWTPFNLTPADSDYTWQGRPFTLLTSTSSGGYQSQAITFTGNAVKVLQFTLRKGTAETDTQILIVDTDASENRLNISVNWSTQAITETTGSVVKASWYNSGTVLELQLLTASVTAANTNVLRLLPSSAGTGNLYVTAVQAEDFAFAHPYVPTSRLRAQLGYNLTPATTGTIDFWTRPWHTYDYGTSRYLFLYGGAAGISTRSVVLYYDQSSDKYIAAIVVDGSNYRRAISTSAFTDNAGLQVWRHIKVVWDAPNQSIKLFVDKVEQTGTASAGTVSGLTFAANKLWIGSAGNATGTDTSADAMFADFCLQASTKDETTTHFDLGMPWYDSAEVANQVQSVRINQAGIRRHNAVDTWTDDYNRLIAISNRDGLLAKDAAGKVIHDIPVSPILSGMAYGGHVIFKEAPNYFDSLTFTFTNTDADAADESSVQNANLSSYIGGLTNLHGVILGVFLHTHLADGKAAVGAYYGAMARYSTVYNTTPGAYNVAARNSAKAVVAAVEHVLRTNHFCIVPVVYDGATPYISWDIKLEFSSMAANSDVYGATAYLYLLGFMV